MLLSILCVTRLEPHATKFLEAMRGLAGQTADCEFVVAVDGEARTPMPNADRIGYVRANGYLESVLDQALQFCKGDYVLRLDDDERCSLAMENWLQGLAFLQADHWCFPRVHLWSDETSVLMTPHLWPDYQTRLSVRAKAGGRHGVHAGSPFGMGEEAPVALEHHKFLVKDRAARLEVARRYDAYAPGYGTGAMKAFSLPEDAYREVTVAAYGDGMVPWTPAWEKTVQMSVS